MTTKEAVKLARNAGYKKYNKVIRSYANRPDETGVQHVPALQKLFDAQEAAEPRTSPTRKDAARITCWVPEALRRKFNASKMRRGFKSDHDYVCFLIIHDALTLEKESAASLQRDGAADKSPQNNKPNPTVHDEQGGCQA